MGTDKPPESTNRHQRRYQPLLVVLVPVGLAIFADRHARLGLACWWILATAGWMAWLVLWRLGRNRTACACLLLAAAGTAGVWHHLQWSRFAADDLGNFAQPIARPVCLEATVEKGSRLLPAPPDDPMRIIPQGDRTQLEIRAERIRHRTGWRSASGRATLVVNDRLPGLHPGDRIRVFGRLAAPGRANNPGELDRADHLRGDRIRAALRADYPACVTLVARGSAWRPSRWLECVQNQASDGLQRRLDPRWAGLGSALLLGNREQLESDQATAFQTTGMAHLLAISGLHVGIVVLAVGWLLRISRVPHTPAAVILVLAAVGYTLLTDAQPPAVRASILVTVLALGIVLGRHPVRFNSLAAAALIVLALNPSDLFQLGPQLSFLAVAALMWISPNWIGPWKGQRSKEPLSALIDQGRPWWQRWYRRKGRQLREFVLDWAVLWVVLSPLIMARFHLFSLAPLILNVLLFAPVMAALSSGFVVLTVGWLVPPLGAAAAWVCNGSLAIIDWGINAAQNVPWSHRWVPGPPDWWLWGFYAVLLVVMLLGRRRVAGRWVVALAAGWVGVGLLAASWPGRAERLDCTFVAVGHGLSVVVELPDGRTMLYDAGGMTSPEGTSRSIAGCLWEKGLTRIDAVVLSHADADHYNAVPGLLRRFTVGVVYVPPGMFSDENRSLAALREAIAAAGVPIRELKAADRLAAGPACSVEVLHPSPDAAWANDNANSLVLLVEYAGRRILLPGDLEPPGIDELLADEPIDSDVLLVPHHGSRHSSPPGLIAWCRPDWAVISGSIARQPEDTETVYQTSGVRVLHTGREGAIRIEVDRAGNLEIQSFRGGVRK